MKQKTVKAICPRCGIKHTKKAYYTGDVTPRFYCNQCYALMQATERSQRDRKYTKRQKSTLLGICASRGLTPEEKAKNDLTYELLGRKLREQFGIQAPAHYYYIRG